MSVQIDIMLLNMKTDHSLDIRWISSTVKRLTCKNILYILPEKYVFIRHLTVRVINLILPFMPIYLGKLNRLYYFNELYNTNLETTKLYCSLKR